MKSVLVTGGTGFIGRHTVPALLQRGYQIHLVVHDRSGPTAHGVTIHQGDLFDSAWQAALLESIRPSHLLHLAWYASHGKFWEAPENAAWVRGSLALFETFTRFGGRRVLMVGSCAEYDWSTTSPCSEETTSLVPRTLYGICKNSLNQVLSAWSARLEISFAWGRLFHLFGPHEDPRRLVPSVINALLDGVPARCTEGHQLRDFLHAAEAASALVSVLDSSIEGAINVASGQAVAVRALVTLIAEKMGRPDLLRLGEIPLAASEPPSLLADVRRLRSLGWHPQRSLEQNLDEVIHWWRDQRPGPFARAPAI